MDKCVLIVDDNDFNRELVNDILEDEDITVYEAEDGSSAIELLESEQADDIDVVLMDMRMPGMDGIETTKIIRTKNDVVFISHGDCLQDAQFVAGLVKERFGIDNIWINYICPTIGTHSGPGTVALFFMGESR